MPPKNDDVVQKLQAIGQPTDGISVAAVAPLRVKALNPMMRKSIPETMCGCWMGALSSSPK